MKLINLPKDTQPEGVELGFETPNRSGSSVLALRNIFCLELRCLIELSEMERFFRYVFCRSLMATYGYGALEMWLVQG